MRVLPLGSSVLDFAFDIHSELGKTCIGAKIDYKLVPINHLLKNADQIEIITSKKQHPNKDWLKFVRTAKANSRIKYYLKEEKRIKAESVKEALIKKLQHHKLPFNSSAIADIANLYKYPSSMDFQYAIAIGNYDLKELAKLRYVGDKFVHLEKEEKKNAEQKETREENFELSKQLPSKGYELLLFDQNSDKIAFKMAACCTPIQGDDVFGFVTSSEGLKIHRTNCPNAASLLANYGHRVVKAKWAKNKEISFLAGVRINGIDDVGIINKITNVVSGEMKLNMRNMSIESSVGLFEGTLHVFVNNKEELNILCQKLERLDGVQTVVRLENE
jgi:GTP pyrophosphokinase